MEPLKHIIAFMILIMLVSCSKEEVEGNFQPQETYKVPISWDVKPLNGQSSPSSSSSSTKALVNNNLLETACTPKPHGTGESIGLWGKYELQSIGQTLTKVEFDATPLVFAPKDTDTNPYNSWNYPGEAKFWERECLYDFRACYPLALMSSLMTQMDATMFQGGPINTMTLQEDILVAAMRVNTSNVNPRGPIQINLEHIFAALRFKVKAVDGFVPPSGEGVTSCWLQNQSSATDLFSPSGYLVHSGNDRPEIKWYPYESSSAPMYEWKHQGVSFARENVLYCSNNGMKGSEYTCNDGWLLVVPQQVKAGSLRFCYTLKNAGNEVFSVEIPSITYEHGKQYTYVLEISGSEAHVTLTIAPWNYMESSYDITM